MESMSGLKDYLIKLQNSCNTEIEIAKKSLDNYSSNFNKLVFYADNYNDDSEECSNFWRKALSYMYEVNSILRKTNALPKPNFEEIISKIRENAQYTYRKPSLSQYEIGYQSHCVVTHVKDKENKLVYIENIDHEYLVCSNLLKQYFENVPNKFVGLPKSGEVFVVCITNYLVRAVRANNIPNTSCSTYKAFLIDIGTEIEVLSDMNIYCLPPLIATFPARAILCKLLEKDFILNLSKISSKKHGFTVVSNDNNILGIKLFVDEEESDKLNNINPFRQYYFQQNFPEIENENSFITNNNSCVESLATTFLNSINNENNILSQNDNEKINNNLSIKKNDFNYVGTILTPDYYKCVDYNKFESQQEVEQSNNYNDDTKDLNSKIKPEMVQSNNYNDDNDMKIIKSKTTSKDTQLKPSLHNFYKSVLNCNSESSSDDDYETSKDISNESETSNSSIQSIISYRKVTSRERISGNAKGDKPVFAVNTKKYNYPEIGSTVTLIPTCIVDINFVFGHFDQVGSEFLDLVREMNYPPIVRKYKPINRDLEANEFIIAIYSDGNWYRAKVIKAFNHISKVVVFYVDYGNVETIKTSEVRQWESFLDQLPFQAVRCKIDGIKPKKLNIITPGIKSVLLNQKLRATIRDRVDKNCSVVTLYDSEGTDVANLISFL